MFCLGMFCLGMFCPDTMQNMYLKCTEERLFVFHLFCYDVIVNFSALVRSFLNFFREMPLKIYLMLDILYTEEEWSCKTLAIQLKNSHKLLL